MFKRDWFAVVDQAPAYGDRVRSWDLAATVGGDYTAGVRLCLTDKRECYIEHIVHGRWTPYERDAVMLQTAQADGLAVRILWEEEGGASGKSLSATLTRMLAGYALQPQRASGDKQVRANALSSYAEAGNVKLVRGAWNQSFLDELCSFPMGAHDDQVDAASYAFNFLVSRPRSRLDVWVAGPQPNRVAAAQV